MLPVAFQQKASKRPCLLSGICKTAAKQELQIKAPKRLRTLNRNPPKLKSRRPNNECSIKLLSEIPDP